jgi:hypothetical protein
MVRRMEGEMNTNGNGQNGDGLQAKSKAHRWKKGQSGNPSGKRKGTVSLAATISRNLTPKTANAIVKKLFTMAKAGDIQAIKLVLERIDGKPVERHELSGPAGGPVDFTINLTGKELQEAFPQRD